jgi:hypothetical protein
MRIRLAYRFALAACFSWLLMNQVWAAERGSTPADPMASVLVMAQDPLYQAVNTVADEPLDRSGSSLQSGAVLTPANAGAQRVAVVTLQSGRFGLSWTANCTTPTNVVTPGFYLRFEIIPDGMIMPVDTIPGWACDVETIPYQDGTVTVKRLYAHGHDADSARALQRVRAALQGQDDVPAPRSPAGSRRR